MNCVAVRDTIVNWLKDQLLTSGQKGFVIGVSGGVDSALVSTLCAMTGKKTLLISMPIHQDKIQLERAKGHIDWLKKEYIMAENYEIDLTKTFELLRTSFIESGSEFVSNDDLAMANTRSRLRMVTLYAYANSHRLLVVGTGNLVEDYGVKFFTKYGDGGVDINPIGDLSKSQVWKLAKFIEVNDSIVTAKPNDGLWKDNRGDEDAIGATYPELEWAMAECKTKGFIYSPDLNHGAIVYNSNYTGRQNVVMSIYLRLHALGMHKLNPIPICKIPRMIL